jgi:hypothetical protein
MQVALSDETVASAPELLLDGRFAEFCRSRAADMPNSVIPLSEAVFVFCADIIERWRYRSTFGLPGNAAPPNHRTGISRRLLDERAAGFLHVIGCSESGKWFFLNHELRSYCFILPGADPDGLNSFVDNVLEHHRSGQQIEDIHVVLSSAIPVLWGNFARLNSIDASGLASASSAASKSRANLPPKGPKRRPLQLIFRENERRVQEGVAAAEISEEAEHLLEWAADNVSYYVLGFDSEEKCLESIRTNLYKEKQVGRQVTCAAPL